MTTLAAWLDSASERFAAAGIFEGRVDAELLAAHALACSRGQLQADAVVGRELDAAELTEMNALAERRAAREPLQHLTGIAPFRQLELRVGPGVFVPRPETEQVVQFAIDTMRAVPHARPRAVDLGTGSGAIALAIASEVPTSEVWAVELSPEARRWSAVNIERYGQGRVSLVAGDLADANIVAADGSSLDGTFDVVISNPPYIPDAAIPRDPEVARFDPALALYGGDDGLDLVRALSHTALRLARPGGTLVIEHGELQASAVADILRADGWQAIASHRDLTGRDRATTALR